MYVLEVFRHVERYGVDDMKACGIVFEFALYAPDCGLQVCRYRSQTRFFVQNTGFWFPRPERIEFLEQGNQLGSDVGEFYLGVDVEMRFELVRLNVVGHIFFETTAELRDVFLFE